MRTLTQKKFDKRIEDNGKEDFNVHNSIIEKNGSVSKLSIDGNQLIAEENKYDTDKEAYSDNIDKNYSCNEEPKVGNEKESSLYQKSIEEHFIQCPFECSYSTKIQDEMFAHLIINHKADIQSNFRIRITRFLQKLKLNISKTCIFSCENPNFTVIQSLQRHYENFHSDNSNSKICSHCDQKFVDLEKHLKSVNLKRTFGCEICGKMFKRKEDLKMHFDSVHNAVAIQCPHCKKVFNWDEKRSKILLKQHIKTVHEGFKPFACDICGIKMSRFANLADHRIKVHGEKKLPMGEYKNMIKSGKYEFLKDVPISKSYNGFDID